MSGSRGSFSKEIGSGGVQGHNQVPYSDNKREFYEWMQLLEKFDTLLLTLYKHIVSQKDIIQRVPDVRTSRIVSETEMTTYTGLYSIKMQEITVQGSVSPVGPVEKEILGIFVA